VPCGFRVVHGEGFSLALPRYWTSSTTAGTQTLLLANGPLAAAAVVRGRVEGSPRDAMARVEQRFDRAPFFSLAEHGVEGVIDAATIEFRHEHRDENRVGVLHGWAFVAVRDGWGYVLTCEVADEETEMLRSTCEGVVGSMVLE